MRSNLRMTLIAGAIGAMLAAPVWAASDTGRTETEAGTGQAMGTAARDARIEGEGAGTGGPTARPQEGMPEVPGTIGATPATPDETARTPGEEAGTGGPTASPQDGAPHTADAADPAAGTADPQPGTPGATAASPGEDAGTGGPTASPQAGLPGSSAESLIYARTPDELRGMEVVDQSGEDFGKVEKITLGPDRQSAHAVISTGEAMGTDAREIVVSLDELTFDVDGKLRLSASRDQVETLPQYSADQQDQYVELSGDRSISESITEFSAFEPGQDATSPGAAPGTPEPGSGSAGEAPGMSQPDIGTPGVAPEAPQTPR